MFGLFLQHLPDFKGIETASQLEAASSELAAPP